MDQYPYPDLSRIRDRKDKWGMQILLPEHRELINELRREDNKVPKPELDRYDWEILEEELAIAIREKSFVTIKVWLDGVVYEKAGVIENISAADRILVLKQGNKNLRIPLNTVFGLLNHYR